jgi:tetratricopeptide (TPR) repeat protein
VFGQAAQINPKDGEIWLRLAEAQMHAGFIDLAASSTAKAIENSDDPVKPLLLRGEIDLQNNNPKGAYQIAEELLEKLPDNLDALLMLSKALVLLDRSEEALKLLKESIPEGSDSLRLKLEYVNLLANCKGINSAIPEITRIYSANPNKPQVLAVLADIHYQSGQLKEAVDSALRALKIDDGELTQETKANLHYIMGQQYHDEGQLDQAIHHLIYAERLNPKDVEILQELGQVYHKRRQYEDAMRYYQMAIDISPNNYYPYYLVGLLLKDKKDYAGAENAIRKASQLEPSDMDVHRMLSAVSALNLIHNKRLVPNEMAAPS